MVVGKGLVAKAFKTYQNNPEAVVFASGVSNSTLTELTSFKREEELLEQTIEANAAKKLIYFSTCSIYDSSLKKSAYVQHKLNMEELITQQHSSYTIFRVSNLAGYSINPNTVLNYFFQHIKKGYFFQVWSNSSRNIIDVEDAFKICDYIINNALFNNEIVNIANPHNTKVASIVKEFETFLDRKGNYEIIEKTSNPLIDISHIQTLFARLNLTFEEDYLKRVIKKYYSVNKL